MPVSFAVVWCDAKYASSLAEVAARTTVADLMQRLSYAPLGAKTSRIAASTRPLLMQLPLRLHELHRDA
jgi:hypothetical protein